MTKTIKIQKKKKKKIKNLKSNQKYFFLGNKNFITFQNEFSVKSKSGIYFSYTIEMHLKGAVVLMQVLYL